MSGILTSGWQTDRARTYVAVSRACEQTQIYVSRYDLGEQGLDTGAIERLVDRIAQSCAQETTITKEVADQVPKRLSGLERNDEAIRTREQEIDEILREAWQRQDDWERGIEPDRRNDPGLAIE